MSNNKMQIQREMKTKHKKYLVKSKRIISVSIGSHMYHPGRLPRICEDAMTSLYEGNSINKNMKFITQLKDVKM